MSDADDSTSTGDSDSEGNSYGDSVSSPFLEFCAKVRSNDPSILPEPGEPFGIRSSLSEKDFMDLADALLENSNVTYLQLDTAKFTKSSAETMGKYIRTSKSLQRIRWNEELDGNDQELRQLANMLCCLLPAFQESVSLKGQGTTHGIASPGWAVQPGARKHVDTYTEPTVSDSKE